MTIEHLAIRVTQKDTELLNYFQAKRLRWLKFPSGHHGWYFLKNVISLLINLYKEFSFFPLWIACIRTQTMNQYHFCLWVIENQLTKLKWSLNSLEGGLHVSPLFSGPFIFQLISTLSNPFLSSTGQLPCPPLSQLPFMITRFLQVFLLSHCSSNILHFNKQN